MPHGFMGKVLWVDLSNEKNPFKEEEIPEEIFINVSESALPGNQDLATNDVDMFDADGRPLILEI